jgi:hypothetical protein
VQIRCDLTGWCVLSGVGRNVSVDMICFFIILEYCIGASKTGIVSSIEIPFVIKNRKAGLRLENIYQQNLLLSYDLFRHVPVHYSIPYYCNSSTSLERSLSIATYS